MGSADANTDFPLDRHPAITLLPETGAGGGGK
jgi:hypothetical protein